MQTTYNQNGNVIAISAVIILIANKFGIIVTQDNIVTIIAGIGAAYGIYTQWVAHKKLAIQVGAILR